MKIDFLQELNLEYGRYLKEIVQALESDPEFRKKLESADVEDIKVTDLYYFCPANEFLN